MPADRFVFAEGQLSVDSDDAGLTGRFRQLYPEDRSGNEVAWAGPAVGCRVRCAEGLAAISFDDPEPLDAFAFCTALFPDRGFVEGPASSPHRPLIALRGDLALADLDQPWQPFVANIAVNRLLRLQRSMLFFHAGAVSVAGKGVLITGVKASGKTTTCLTLASRGHGFLGDEIGALRMRDSTLLPIRRAVAIRHGVRAREVERQLAVVPHEVEIFPDGEERTRVVVAQLFPQAGAMPAPLSLALLLRGKRSVPNAERFEFGFEHAGQLTPLPCCFWGRSAARLMMDLARLMRRVHCYHLDVGPPEETAALIEQLVRGLAE